MKRIMLVEKEESRFSGLSGYEPETEAEFLSLAGVSVFEAAVQFLITKQYLLALSANRRKENPATTVATMQVELDKYVASGKKLASGRQAADPFKATVNKAAKGLKVLSEDVRAKAMLELEALLAKIQNNTI